MHSDSQHANSLSVMHVIDSLARGGAERMLVDIANASYAEGVRVSVCVTRSDVSLASELDPGIILYALDRQRRFELKPLQRLSTILKQESVMILHVHSRSTLYLIAFARLLGFVPRTIAIVMHDHYGSIETDPSISKSFQYWARHEVDAYVGVHPALADWAVRAGMSPERVFTMTNALNLDRLKCGQPSDLGPLFKHNEERPVGVVIGSLNEQKGVDLLLQATQQSHQQYDLLIIGPDANPSYAQYCREKAAQPPLVDRVNFMGPRDDVPALLQSCDFAVIASRSESGPLVLIEYLFAGLPFVSTLVGSIAHAVAAHDQESFVPPEDVSELSKAIDKLVALSPADRRLRGQAGTAIATAHFDIRKKIPQWLRIYEAAYHHKQGTHPA